METASGKRIYTCAICGREYKSTAPNIKYCSLYCREQGRLESRSTWKRNHPEYYRQYMREYRSIKMKGDNNEIKECTDRDKKEA